jgi:hypothetical protein
VAARLLVAICSRRSSARPLRSTLGKTLRIDDIARDTGAVLPGRARRVALQLALLDEADRARWSQNSISSQRR